MAHIKLIAILLLLLVIPASVVFGQDEAEGNRLQVVFSVDAKPADLKIEDVRAAAEVILRRLQGINIEGAVVQVIAEKAIQVQMPGMDDPQPVIDALTQTALLEFVDFSGLRDQIDTLKGTTIITSAWQENVNYAPRENGLLNPLTNNPFETIVTGADFASLDTSLDSNGQWVVNFELTDEAGQRFADYTETYIDEPLAIVLDGHVLSIPVIQNRLEKQGVIVGNFTQNDVTRLAAQLRAGVLTLPLKVRSIETVETITVSEPG